jgi:hypothetical protein
MKARNGGARRAALVALWLASACSSGAKPGGGTVGSPDAGVTVDGGAMDASAGDAALPDAALPDAAVPAHDCTSSGGIVALTNGDVRVDYDLNAGTASFFYAGVKKVASFYAGVQLSSYVTSKMYANRSCVTDGVQTTVTNTGSGLPTMQQLFILSGGGHLLSRVVLQGSGLSTNWIAPVVMDTAGGVDIGSYGDARALWIPFDNDSFVTYGAASINNTGTSFEAAAFYDNVTRNGIVVGSVTHDTWKSGVYYNGANNKLNALNVFGGATDATWTHDKVAHGKVTGDVLYSPIVFVGYGSDWRDLMEEYADANAVYDGKLAWSGGVPFGWNSWGVIKTAITYDKAVAVSDYIKNNLQTSSLNNNGTVYVNLDAFWDYNMSDTQVTNFVAHCHANGQKTGVYWTPFADWSKSSTRVVENSSYTYGQIWVKDGSGNPIDLDGAYAIDPSHPGAKSRIDYFIDKFKTFGFDYIKLDFLTHGALESSARFDSTVQTGIQAYNQGMQHIRDRIAGSMFISESIAPLFPYKYAHARRVSCDTFGAAVGAQASSQYELNSVTYGWWMNGRLYQFNDPDQMVFQGFTNGDNITRLISGAISGTVFLDGDDLTSSSGQALAQAYLTNSRINAVARLGKSFRPVEGNSGTADLMVLQDSGVTYLAVFNFGNSAVNRSIDLGRAGLDGAHSYAVTDLWSGATSTATGQLNVALDATSAKLIQLK